MDETISHTVGNDQADVQITVTIGDGQSASAIGLKKADGTRKKGALSNESLGKGASLRGKESSLKVIVADTNSSTNQTSVTVKLTNMDKSEIYSQMVDQDGGSATYEIVIKHS